MAVTEPDGVSVAASLLQATVHRGASRQVVSAVAAALWRLCVKADTVSEAATEEEVAMRLEMTRLCLQAMVNAGADGGASQGA